MLHFHILKALINGFPYFLKTPVTRPLINVYEDLPSTGINCGFYRRHLFFSLATKQFQVKADYDRLTHEPAVTGKYSVIEWFRVTIPSMIIC